MGDDVKESRFLQSDVMFMNEKTNPVVLFVAKNFNRCYKHSPCHDSSQQQFQRYRSIYFHFISKNTILTGMIPHGTRQEAEQTDSCSHQMISNKNHQKLPTRISNSSSISRLVVKIHQNSKVKFSTPDSVCESFC